MKFLNIFFLGKFVLTLDEIKGDIIELINKDRDITIMREDVFRKVNVNFINIFISFEDIFNLVNLIRVHCKEVSRSNR